MRRRAVLARMLTLGGSPVAANPLIGSHDTPSELQSPPFTDGDGRKLLLADSSPPGPAPEHLGHVVRALSGGDAFSASPVPRSRTIQVSGSMRLQEVFVPAPGACSRGR
jgi:hypothetical protein